VATARKKSTSSAPRKSNRKRSGEVGETEPLTPSPPSPAPSEPGLGLVGHTFTPTREPAPAVTAADLDDDLYEPEPPAPFQWDAEKAESVVRIVGLVAHTVDPLSNSEFADDLWKADDEDCREIAPPLARIMNRHASLRQLAGFSDEAELTAAMWSYTRKNTAQRGRIKMFEKRAADAGNDAHRSLYEPEQPHAEVPVAPAPPPPAEPPHLAEPKLEIVGETANDFDEIAPAGVTGDDLGMFGATIRGPRHGLMPDLEPDQLS
jgi:hypothetical protein